MGKKNLKTKHHVSVVGETFKEVYVMPHQDPRITKKLTFEVIMFMRYQFMRENNRTPTHLNVNINDGEAFIDEIRASGYMEYSLAWGKVLVGGMIMLRTPDLEPGEWFVSEKKP